MTDTFRPGDLVHWVPPTVFGVVESVNGGTVKVRWPGGELAQWMSVGSLKRFTPPSSDYAQPFREALAKSIEEEIVMGDKGKPFAVGDRVRFWDGCRVGVITGINTVMAAIRWDDGHGWPETNARLDDLVHLSTPADPVGILRDALADLMLAVSGGSIAATTGTLTASKNGWTVWERCQQVMEQTKGGAS